MPLRPSERPISGPAFLCGVEIEARCLPRRRDDAHRRRRARLEDVVGILVRRAEPEPRQWFRRRRFPCRRSRGTRRLRVGAHAAVRPGPAARVPATPIAAPRAQERAQERVQASESPRAQRFESSWTRRCAIRGVRRRSQRWSDDFRRNDRAAAPASDAERAVRARSAAAAPVPDAGAAAARRRRDDRRRDLDRRRRHRRRLHFRHGRRRRLGRDPRRMTTGVSTGDVIGTAGVTSRSTIGARNGARRAEAPARAASRGDRSGRRWRGGRLDRTRGFPCGFRGGSGGTSSPARYRFRGSFRRHGFWRWLDRLVDDLRRAAIETRQRVRRGRPTRSQRRGIDRRRRRGRVGGRVGGRRTALASAVRRDGAPPVRAGAATPPLDSPPGGMRTAIPVSGATSASMTSRYVVRRRSLPPAPRSAVPIDHDQSTCSSSDSSTNCRTATVLADRVAAAISRLRPVCSSSQAAVIAASLRRRGVRAAAMLRKRRGGTVNGRTCRAQRNRASSRRVQREKTPATASTRSRRTHAYSACFALRIPTTKSRATSPGCTT